MPTARLPDGPKSALPQLLNPGDPFPLMDRLSQRYSDPLTCPILGQSPMVLTWSPEGIQSVFAADPDTFLPGAPEALAAIVGQGSLFIKYGTEHKQARKLLMPPFHGERMKAYAEVMQAATLRWLERVELGRSQPILPTAQGITLDIIIEAIFGATRPEQVQQLHTEILSVVRSFNPLVATFRFLQKQFGGFGPWANFQKALSELRSTIDQLIEEKRRDPGQDVLSLLLSARDEDGQPLPEQEIHEQLLTFVIAGHETTATSLAWALYELHANPGVLAELQAELQALDEANPEALAKLPFLSAVTQETLRRHPPVPIVPRKCAREFTLGEYVLPAGQTLGVAVYMAHHQEDIYPEPYSFRPSRFLDERFSPFTFLPFGGGNRRCVGAAFASYELKIVLGTLLTQARFELSEKKPVVNEFRIGTYGPKGGVRLTRVS